MPILDIVIPVYNEEKILAQSVRTLADFLKDNSFPEHRIIIADNASVDRTPEVGRRLAAEIPYVHYLRLEQKGRGRALKKAWLESDAEIVCYMDVDLSTNLQALRPLLAPLLSGECHIASGCRLMKGARITRQWKREILSRGYNTSVKCFFPRRRFKDAQCGFKALTRQAAAELVPLCQDNAWFFDTELLLRAEERGYTIHEVPVEWIEDLDSRVKIVHTAWEDIKGLIRVRLTPLKRKSFSYCR